MIQKTGTESIKVLDGESLRPEVWKALRSKAEYVSTEEGRKYQDFYVYGDNGLDELVESEEDKAEMKEFIKIANYGKVLIIWSGE